jgi:hypothetical protein
VVPDVREHESAQRAATQDDGTRKEEENDQCRARRIITGVLERVSEQQAVARVEPGVIENKSAQRAVARVEPSVREITMIDFCEGEKQRNFETRGLCAVLLPIG